MSGAAGRGAAAAALIVALGSTAPALAAQSAGPSLQGGEVAGSAGSAGSGHGAEHQVDSPGHAGHEGSHSASGDENHDSHDSHDLGAGADVAHDGHSDDAGHGSHDGDASSDHGSHEGDSSSGHGDDADHGGEPDTVSGATKARVLGGFGVVNAVAVGGAFLLRRRDRKHATKAGRVRADQSRTGRSR